MIPLSSRLDDLQRSPIRQFTALARQTPGCILLTIGEPDFDTPAPIKEAAAAALSDNQTHYAPNQGIPALRQAIAETENRRGFSCTAEQVIVTVGATQALYTALTGILNPGDEVVVPVPAFNLYQSIISAAGAVFVPLHTEDTGFQLTPEALERCITPRTKAIILNSPNNPTGVVLSRASLEAVAAALRHREIFLICDNVYDRLARTPVPDLCTEPTLRDQVILCQSFSKPWAMTGWRVGYLVAPEAVTPKLLLHHAAQVAAVPTFLQQACITALSLDTSPMARVYDRRRDFVCRRLTEMGLPFPRPEGAFYVFPDIRPYGLTAPEFCTRMIREAGVAAVPGDCFCCPGHIRLSCAASDEDLALGMDRLEAFLHTLKAAEH